MAMSKRAFGPLPLFIFLVIVLGAFLRVVYFDLMEFKADEVEALLLTKYWLNCGLPRFGLVSGVGIRNPPGFIFLLLPVVRATSSPLRIGFYITVFNVAALWLIYRLAVRLEAPLAGFWACGFMATHPWLILYARKIWAQSLLPFFVLLFLIVIAGCTKRPRSRLIFWVGPLLSLTWQIHYSAYCLLVFFVIWFLSQAIRKRVSWYPALAGFLLGMIILSPYLHYLVKTGFGDIRGSLRVGGGSGPFENGLWLIKQWGGTSLAGGFGYPFAFKTIPLSQTPLGMEKPWLQPLAAIGTILILILVASGVFLSRSKEKSGPFSCRFAPWLILLAVLPVVLYAVKGIKAPPHHFIISLPALLLLAGLGTARLTAFLKKKSRGSKNLFLLPALLGIVVMICGTVIWLSFIMYINRVGGTSGDYGLAYRVQESAAEKLVEEGIRPRFIDPRLTRDNSIGIYYLLERPHLPARPYANKNARLIDSLLFPDRRCSPDEKRVAAPNLGPLKICLSFPNKKAIQPGFIKSNGFSE